MIYIQTKKLPAFRQVILSHWNKRVPVGTEHNVIVNAGRPTLAQKLYLLLPERARKPFFNGITDSAHLSYLWRIKRVLPVLRPKIIVCYDSYKMGPLLRRRITWPCRLVFSQHGLSYFLPPHEAARLYSLSSFDAVITLTGASYRSNRAVISAYEPLVVTIPNGIDTEKFRPAAPGEKDLVRQEFGLPENKMIVLFLSRLVPKKGAHAILHSWRKILTEIPDAYLWIVGGGHAGYERYLGNLITASGISSSVRLQGRVSPDVTARCYQASDIYLFPTLCVEGHSLSLLEAISCGIPCISSHHETARELYSDDEVLFVEDPNVEDAFVGPVIRLLKDKTLRRKLGDNARRAAEQRFNQDKWLCRLREFYERQLNLVKGRE